MTMEAEDDAGGSCPICLLDMSAADICHPVDCPTATCRFNFCLTCLERLLLSSRDDYEVASDGSRRVKVRLNCPSCRAEIAGSIEATITARRRALARALRERSDGDLSARELRQKYWQEEGGVRGGEEAGATSKCPDIDPTLLGGLETLMTEEEKEFVVRLMTSGSPDGLSEAAQILAGIADLVRSGKRLPTHSPAKNNSRNNGGNDNVNANASPRSRDGERMSQIQKQNEHKARERARRPLPARMPLAVTLSAGDFEGLARQAREGPAAPPAEPPGWLGRFLGRRCSDSRAGACDLTFADDGWDGSVADAFARARLGPGEDGVPAVRARVPGPPAERRGIAAILAADGGAAAREPMAPPVRFQRVLVATARGTAGRAGVRAGDVVTHVDGREFAGDAAALVALLVLAYEERGRDGVVMLVVNAEECTAAALRLRSYVR